MINPAALALGTKRNTILELADYGRSRAAIIGKENVFDFSIGNPSVAAPETVKRVMVDLLENTDPVALHGYTSAQGDAGVRAAIAQDIAQEFFHKTITGFMAGKSCCCSDNHCIPQTD